MIEEKENIYQEKWMYEPKEGEQFFFMHIPKTGGTTLRKILTNHFPKSSLYPSDKDLLDNNGKYFSQKELITNRQEILSRSLIIGHYNVDLIQHLKPNVKVFTIFRNPFDRVISHLNHILRQSEKQNRDVNDLVVKMLSKLSKTQLSFLRQGASNNSEKAIFTLEKINVFGLMEYYEESIIKLNKEFGWSLKYSGERENSIERNLRNELNKDTLELIKKAIEQEQVFYQKCLFLLNKI